MVEAVRRTLTKAGQQILSVQLEDTTGSFEVVVFAKLYPQVQALFEQDKILIVKGRLCMRERPALRQPFVKARDDIAQDDKEVDAPTDISVTANEVLPFERRAHAAQPAGWHVTVNTREQIDRLAAILDEWPGTIPLMARIGDRTQRLPRGVAGDHRLKHELERIFGHGNVSEGLPE